MKSFPKTLTGIGVIIFGACFNFVPAVGPVAAPLIMKAGVGIATVGGADKIYKRFKGKDAFEKEKTIINKMKKKGR